MFQTNCHFFASKHLLTWKLYRTNISHSPVTTLVTCALYSHDNTAKLKLLNYFFEPT